LRRFLIYAKSPTLAPFLRRYVWGAERPHRFGPSRPLAATYRAVGGHNLQAAGVAKASHREPPPLAPQRARLDRLSCRRKVLLTVPGFNESRRRDWTLWHGSAGDLGSPTPPGSLFLRSASHLGPQPLAPARLATWLAKMKTKTNPEQSNALGVVHRLPST
jgi:hypothetical protein